MNGIHFHFSIEWGKQSQEKEETQLDALVENRVSTKHETPEIGFGRKTEQG